MKKALIYLIAPMVFFYFAGILIEHDFNLFHWNSNVLVFLVGLSIGSTFSLLINDIIQ